MADVLPFRYHHRLRGVDVPCDCSKEGGGWECMTCAGGLALCVVCGGAEGSMPTDCPGCAMEPEVAEAVYAGEVDYDAREGWVQRPSNYGRAPRLVPSGAAGLVREEVPASVSVAEIRRRRQAREAALTRSAERKKPSFKAPGDHTRQANAGVSLPTLNLPPLSQED